MKKAPPLILLVALITLSLGCSNFQRFVPIGDDNDWDMALDTKTGELCRTNKVSKKTKLPLCADLAKW